MPCLLAILALLFPRVIIVLLYVFSGFFGGVFDSALVGLAGFIFLPVTLLAYTWLHNTQQLNGTFFFVVMGLAVAFDLGLLGGGAKSRQT